MATLSQQEKFLQEISVSSSLGEIEEFKRSKIWNDMQNAINQFRDDALNELRTEKDVIQIYRVQGEILAYELFLTIPDAMLVNKEIDTHNSQD